MAERDEINDREIVMINKKELLDFLLRARVKTYAGAGGEVNPRFEGSKQLEFAEEKWFYRDIFYVGNGIFFGMDVVHFDSKPVWGTSYYGNFKGMTEDETDKILRKALVALWDKTRLWETVQWDERGYSYVCKGNGSLEELEGREEISKHNKVIFAFNYRGGMIAEE